MQLNSSRDKIKALSMMVGYIVGVGMFSLPYLTVKSGILIFLAMLCALGFMQYLLHLIYGDIIIQTEGRHRIAGYAGIYLGKTGKYVAFAAKMIGNLGAMLAYIIITGIFANQLLYPIFGGNEFIYGNIFFFVQAFIVFFGLRIICEFELMMTGLLVLTILLISAKGLSQIIPSNYSLIDWKYLFLPYGAMLFAVDGLGSIPMVVNLLKNNKDDSKKVIRAGTFMSVILMIIFTVVIVGVTGQHTTPDALSGINKVMGNGVVVISLILGLLTIVTSFVGVAEAIKETLMFDFKVGKKQSWMIAVFIPYLFYLLGFNNLIKVISFAGAITGGISAIILILIFWKMEKIKKQLLYFKKKPSLILLGIFVVLFMLGMIYEIWSFNGS